MKILAKIKHTIKKIVTHNLFEAEMLNKLLYLYSQEALPPTLTAQQEKDLIEQLDNSSEVAKQKLIEHNLRLVVYIAKKFENTDAEIEDLISIGSIGLIKAINSYKSEKNIKIATYASKCIENEILMHLRKISKNKREMSMSVPLTTDMEGNELLISDIIPADQNSPEEDMLEELERRVLWSVLNKLHSREKEIMLMRFGLNGDFELTQKEVATTLGISQSYISRLEKKIVSRIKKEMSKQI